MLIQEVAEVENSSTLADAQEIGAQLQSAMEDLYYAHRMGNPNPTVKQNIDMLQKSIRSFNQELNGLGYKYAPTVPGLVARMGTRFVEDELNEGPIVPRIIHPGQVSVYVRNGKRPPAMIATDIPYAILDKYIEKIMQKYPQFKITDFSFKSSDKITEFALPGGDDREPDEEHILKQLAAQWWLGTEQQMARAQQTLAAMGWEIGQDESGDDDAGVFLIRAGDENGDSYIAFPHSELSLDEGFRVAAPQIRGTKNRAQSAYYPTNAKPNAPKLDKPLTDQELARLSQLAGIKSNK